MKHKKHSGGSPSPVTSQVSTLQETPARVILANYDSHGEYRHSNGPIEVTPSSRQIPLDRGKKIAILYVARIKYWFSWKIELENQEQFLPLTLKEIISVDQLADAVFLLAMCKERSSDPIQKACK